MALSKLWMFVKVGVALLHHLLETATLKVPVLDRRGGMPQPGRMQVVHGSPAASCITNAASVMQISGIRCLVAWSASAGLTVTW